MTNDKAMDRCEVIRSMILNRVEIKIEPTAENLEWIDACAEALEKQIEMIPDYEGDGYDNNGQLIYDTWICPHCGTRYEIDYDVYEYCPNCGQRVKNVYETMAEDAEEQEEVK